MSTQPNLPPIVRECFALREIADWAETLLCNSETPTTCTHAEWNETIKKWRDQKHALRAKSTEEIVQERETQISP